MSDLDSVQATTQFAYLFRGRTDAWGAVHGESVQEEVGRAHYAAHLWTPNSSLGIYPLVKTPAGMRVPWGCTDIDNKADPEACLPLARNLHKALQLLGITSWVERTKGKGYHVWVFVDGWAAAENMRQALLFAHQVAGVAPTEVNPKQTGTAGLKVGLGNYVNLPYPDVASIVDRRVVLDPDTGMPMPLGGFVAAAMSSLNPVQTIADAAARYVPPPPPKKVHIDAYEGTVTKELTDKLSPLAWRIFSEGPLEGRDRSTTLARLAQLMGEDQKVTAAEALALLSDADIRWGKFIERDEPEQLDRMIESAWNKHRDLTATKAS